METRTFHKERCQSCVRRYKKLDKGAEPVILIVTGQHAFAWSVTIQKQGKSSTLRLPNSTAALKEYNSLISTYNKNGTVRHYI